MTAFRQQPGNLLQRRTMERRPILGKGLLNISYKITG
jgi:hypothetical protein